MDGARLGCWFAVTVLSGVPLGGFPLSDIPLVTVQRLLVVSGGAGQVFLRMGKGERRLTVLRDRGNVFLVGRSSRVLGDAMTDAEIREAEVEAWASSVDWENDILLGRKPNHLGLVLQIMWNVFRCSVFAVTGYFDIQLGEMVMALMDIPMTALSVPYEWSLGVIADFLKGVLPEGMVRERE